ncbi:MOB kinase activator-like 4 [Escovopsis weberi]|uniref:MOB kinase activator-like 4 n=1 Tax=Escovopsis weberi TaxID=150374 RepID=A0A0M8N270_ESCWE|nr:MOB kinase activator-like 4 [Escovopsis weberi]
MSLAPTSPRLPSPPPAAEIQFGPNSPAGEPAAMLEASEIEQSHLDANSRRRIHPGTKSCDMAAGPPLVPLNELDSPFQLQEHLAALHYHHTKSGTEALTRLAALHLTQSPSGIDRTLWLYELCRFLISQCNSLIIGFLFDTPPCSATTCPEMRASEWQFLCAVHEQPKSCCAIDYCCHTLDWAANVVSDQRIFPSRFVVVNDAQSKNVGIKSLVNVFRRLHRIFAHAWFQHRSVFWSVEGQTGLYLFFKTVCDLYDLLPAENYILPPEAEGLEAPAAESEAEKPPPTILKPPTRGTAPEEENIHVSRTSTRRHIRSSPSTGSSVTTVPESDEEDAGRVSRRLRSMHHLPPSTVQEESEIAEVPVIVEQGMFDGPPPTIFEAPTEAAPELPSRQQMESKQDEAPPAETAPTDPGVESFPEPTAEAARPAEDETEPGKPLENEPETLRSAEDPTVANGDEADAGADADAQTVIVTEEEETNEVATSHATPDTSEEMGGPSESPTSTDKATTDTPEKSSIDGEPAAAFDEVS